MSAHVAVSRVAAGDGFRFAVAVEEFGATRRYDVTLSAADFERLGRDGEPPETFVERCFLFLLEREPKESILPSFDIAVIARYFPEFESEIAG
jgi:hypothetical protein